eukprot:gnl/Trimastix_PCT/2886.p1 GENE.gnl/Trimastix_PCT/2886~~gnl/Trimastix_PCT/2886.p1  ORF type:complete len:468 (+),score=150.18 gnl/Trimastix_PCT/2886:65-1468(+)
MSEQKPEQATQPQPQLQPPGMRPPPQPKPKLTKAERRAIQEAQRKKKEEERAAQQSKQGKAPQGKAQQGKAQQGRAQQSKGAPSRGHTMRESKGAAVKKQGKGLAHVPSREDPRIFSHLSSYQHITLRKAEGGHPISNAHPAILEVGMKIHRGTIAGGNACCLAMLAAFKRVVADYTTPPNRAIAFELPKALNAQYQCLARCRAPSIGMGNAYNSLAQRVTQIPPDVLEHEAKRTLLEHIESWEQTRITRAVDNIVATGVERIEDGDVVLTYGFSNTVLGIIEHAWKEENKRFRLVIADSRPSYSGLVLLRRITHLSIPVSYILLNGVACMMKEVTKIFLGAEGLCSNGYAIAPVGTAPIALVAAVQKKPVMICCETYKFSERVQLDAICSNEMGDPDALLETAEHRELLGAWRQTTTPRGGRTLQLVNPLFDLLPTEYIDMVITEMGMLPPTSVPVIIREYVKEFS